MWLFAVVVAYPYLPGSGTDAFKGVSVFVGLMLSLGSSGLVNQAMSSIMITYSRALRLGDFVRIGEVEGTVVHAGMLATKVLTKGNEEITLPNAVVASSTITNYSRHSGAGVMTRTSVTIGYDTPWRQVEAAHGCVAESKQPEVERKVLETRSAGSCATLVGRG
jgi:small-conductance mechanosensitive channel